MSCNRVKEIRSLPVWDGVRKFSLDPILKILQVFDNPQNQGIAFHIVGTNGKGSTTLLLSSMLRSAGNNTGMLISPHIWSVEERISLNGKEIAPERLDTYLLDIDRELEQHNLSLSLYEYLVLSAFLYFRDENVDVMVLETGLGGRLDATNTRLHTEYGALSGIGFDHTHILGDTLSEIAKEKAGIMRRGMRFFSAHIEKEAFLVVKAAARASDIQKLSTIPDLDPLYFEKISKIGSPWVKNCIQSKHGRSNLSLAINIAENYGVSKAVIIKALRNVQWPCRLNEVLFKDKLLIFDAAHNPQGAHGLVSYLNARAITPYILCLTLLNKEQWKDTFQILSEHATKVYYVEIDSPRVVSYRELLSYAKHIGIDQKLSLSEANKFPLAELLYQDVNHIVCTGSLSLFSSFPEFREYIQSFTW